MQHKRTGQHARKKKKDTETQVATAAFLSKEKAFFVLSNRPDSNTMNTHAQVYKWTPNKTTRRTVCRLIKKDNEKDQKKIKKQPPCCTRRREECGSHSGWDREQSEKIKATRAQYLT